MKKAIIAASYGTVSAAARTNSIDTLEAALAETFPDYEIRRAFTGRRIRTLLKEQGISVDSVEEALARLAADGYDEAAIQPSHIISGSEYDSVCEAAAAFHGLFSKLVIGTPLLSGKADLEAVCRLLYENLAASDNEVVIMGHGSEHHANRLYADFANTCRMLGCTHMHIATLESSPNLDDLLPLLKASGRSKITLTPLLFVAGDHACRDMAGDEPHSWKSRLITEGFDVTAVVKGLGEYPEIRALYAAHLSAAIAK